MKWWFLFLFVLTATEAIGVQAIADPPPAPQVAPSFANPLVPSRTAASLSSLVAHQKSNSASGALMPDLPGDSARMAALRHRYQNDPGFRQMVHNFNAMQGHPDRGEAASLRVLDQLAIAGAPASALITAIQPRPSFLRALQRHWQRQRPSDGTAR